MKAVNYQGAFKAKVEDVPKPAIEHPDDVIVKVTTAGKSDGKTMVSVSLSLQPILFSDSDAKHTKMVLADKDQCVE